MIIKSFSAFDPINSMIKLKPQLDKFILSNTQPIFIFKTSILVFLKFSKLLIKEHKKMKGRRKRRKAKRRRKIIKSKAAS